MEDLENYYKITDLSNIEGVEMKVSNDNNEWFIREIVAHIYNEVYIDCFGDRWSYCKNIELPQYTIEELENILGHKFIIK